MGQIPYNIQLSSGMVSLFRLKQENRCLGDQGVDGDQFNFHTLEKTYSCAETPKNESKKFLQSSENRSERVKQHNGTAFNI